MRAIFIRKKFKSGSILPEDCPYNGSHCVSKIGQCIGFVRVETASNDRECVLCRYEDWVLGDAEQ